MRSVNGRMWEVKHGAYTIKEKKRFGWYIQGDGKILPLEPSGALEIL